MTQLAPHSKGFRQPRRITLSLAGDERLLCAAQLLGRTTSPLVIALVLLAMALAHIRGRAVPLLPLPAHFD